MDISPKGESMLNDEVCKTANRIRLGIKKISTTHTVQCTCGKDADGGDHFLTCTSVRKGAITDRHNSVRTALAKCIQLVNGSSKDLDHGYTVNKSGETNERQDLEVFLGSSYYIIDVQVKHPTATSNLRNAIKCLGAAEDGEMEKRKKHKDIVELLCVCVWVWVWV